MIYIKKIFGILFIAWGTYSLIVSPKLLNITRITKGRVAFEDYAAILLFILIGFVPGYFLLKKKRKTKKGGV